MYKKVVLILSIIAGVCVIAGIAYQVFFRRTAEPDFQTSSDIVLTVPAIDSQGISVSFRAVDSYFYTLDQDTWRFVYLKGVNMGLTEATTDLSNPNVSYETYREWLSLIAQMNVNTVRVFTVMPPQFYDALYDHNRSAQTPLYLIQGIWFNENDMYECDHAFAEDGRILSAFKRAAKETVDIIHGNSDYTDYGEIKNAVYSKDLSSYLVGYILGLEWDPYFVLRTNEQISKTGYHGEFLTTTESATPFENFLCEVGESLIAYETETYSAQTPIAFLNWATTDTLTHSNEPFEEEDLVSVNTENIQSTNAYHCGLFAAVDVYPYYPEFMNYQPEYLQKDSSGTVNPYQAYLADLRTQYSVPVIVAEFGIPTSRGVAHRSAVGLNQGGITEEQQGQAVVSMMQDIAEEKYAGALIFSWQDEWFKQTWNTTKYAPDDASARTPNVQSAEQSYGILAMEPGEESICYIDGLDEEWQQVDPVFEGNGTSLSAMWDEGYLYLKIEKDSLNFSEETLLIPIQITGLGSRFCTEYGNTFSENVDFLLVIDGSDQTRLLTDSYQDLFYHTYSYEKGVFERDLDLEQPQTGKYVPIRQFLSNEIVLPQSGQTIAPQYTESGLLTYGITDPDSSQYHSLADFYCRGNIIEVRIPWYLLNVMNSTVGVCLGDFYVEDAAEWSTFTDVRLGLASPGQTDVPLYIMGYTTKSESSFHTRLKKSYEIICQGMQDFMEY